MIYLDNAATTRMKEEVLDAMKPYFLDYYGNPSAIYQFALRSKAAIDRARDSAAAVLGVRPDTIYFTSGGTESDNWAIKAACDAFPDRHHIITSRIEHHAVLHTCQYLARKGYRITYLPVDQAGNVDPAALEAAIDADTAIVSVMTANNEIGTIEPVQELAEICHRHGVLFHTDAVQAFGQIPLSAETMGFDLLSASGHKLHGPKGTGLLYIRDGVKIGPLLHGGAQERNRRAGTENVPGIVGFGEACALACRGMDERIRRISAMRDHLIRRILNEIPDSRLNGDPENRLPNNVNVSFRGVEGESLLIMLDMKGIAASSGSACTAGSIDPSHVQIACGASPEEARESLRLTLSDETTHEEIDEAADTIRSIIQELRSMSPLYA